MSCKHLTWCSGYSARTAAAVRRAAPRYIAQFLQAFKGRRAGPTNSSVESAEPFTAVYALLSTLNTQHGRSRSSWISLRASMTRLPCCLPYSLPASPVSGQPASKQPFLFVHDRNSYEKENVRVLSSVTVRLYWIGYNLVVLTNFTSFIIRSIQNKTPVKLENVLCK